LTGAGSSIKDMALSAPLFFCGLEDAAEAADACVLADFADGGIETQQKVNGSKPTNYGFGPWQTVAVTCLEPLQRKHCCGTTCLKPLQTVAVTCLKPLQTVAVTCLKPPTCHMSHVTRWLTVVLLATHSPPSLLQTNALMLTYKHNPFRNPRITPAQE
jgi:hypothetical protein